MSRSVVGYPARRRSDEAELVRKIHKLAVRKSRYGYRRIAVLLWMAAQYGESEAGPPNLEGRRAESAAEAAEETPDGSSR